MRDERTPDAPILQPVVEAVKVLLVEDHPMMVEGLRISLERAGLDVCGAALTAADGLELARRHQPQVAVLDFNLPDSTGAELAAQLREASPETAVIFGMPQEAIKSGAVDHTLAIDDIYAAIEKHVLKICKASPVGVK